MKHLRTLHLYIGCFFTPALALFLVSGSWQTFHVHNPKKNGGYIAPALVRVVSEIHTHQRHLVGSQHPPSRGFKAFVLAMVGFLTLTVAIGIRLALQVSQRRWLVWACLAAGVLLPLLLLRFG